MTVGDPALAQSLVDGLGAGTVHSSFGQAAVLVEPDDWVRAARHARDELGCALFDHLVVSDAGGPGQAGIDHGRTWEVVLHVVVLPRDGAGVRGLLLRTRVEVGGVLPSLTGVWAGAAWAEREAAEMAGLEVRGHPDLRSLLLAPGTGMHPLRKDALLVARSVRPWPGRLEPGEDGSAPATRAGRRTVTAPGVAPAAWARPAGS